MPDIEAKIAERVDAFVAELRDLVRQAALEAVTEVLEAPSDRRSSRRPSSGGGKKAAPRRAVGKKRAASRKRKGGRRSADDIAEQAEAVKRFIDDNPDGVRADQIAAALGIDTGELVLPVKKLLSDKAVKRTGQRRATRYFPKK